MNKKPRYAVMLEGNKTIYRGNSRFVAWTLWEFQNLPCINILQQPKPDKPTFKKLRFHPLFSS